MFKVTPDPTNCVQFKDDTYVKESFDAVVNVSDSPCKTFDYIKLGIPSFWYPIHEVWIWGYAPFFGTAKVLDEFYKTKPILLHCHAGVNRSANVAYAVLKAEGYNNKEIQERSGIDANFTENLFNRNISRKYVPHDIIEFLQARKQYPTYSLMGLLGKMGSSNMYL